MKWLADILKKMKPRFEKGGTCEAAGPVFEAVESFLFTTDAVNEGKVHVQGFVGL